MSSERRRRIEYGCLCKTHHHYDHFYRRGNLPVGLTSVSVSLLCAEPNGEAESVGERIVGDMGVAEPEKIPTDE